MNTAAQDYHTFLQGNQDALVRIIDQHKDGLILYLNGIVSNLDVAEDLTEDVFLKLVLKKPRFSAKSSFKTWLYSIGRNLALDYLRRSKRLEPEPEAAVADLLDLEKQYLRQEDRLFVHQVMKQLRPEYRQVLWLIYFEEFTCAEAGKILKKSTHNVETLVYRARQALKLKLLKEGFLYENQ